jgi:ribonucleoside-diphosphate reductase class Ib glutaredoxin subunit (EC 1.17.4.1)
MRIIIYTKNNCVQCNATKNAMDRKGIDYQLINLDTQPEAIDNLKSLGYRQVPSGDDTRRPLERLPP